MRPEEADNAYLWDMLDAANAIEQFIAGKTAKDYMNDRMLRGAVERHLEIIGEAANKVSHSFREAYTDIPWRRIINQRHVLAHEYGEIRHELIWNVITDRIPELIDQLEQCVPEAPEQ